MRVDAAVVMREGFTCADSMVLQDDEELAVVIGCGEEVVHRLVPDRELGAWHVTANSPPVRFAFDNDFLIGTSKVETVVFLRSTDSYRYGEVLLERQRLGVTKIFGNRALEVSAGVSVTGRPYSLEFRHVATLPRSAAVLNHI